MSDLILDNLTINQPVADQTALAALVAADSADLAEGMKVVVNSDTNSLPSTYFWDGSAMELDLPNIDMATAKAVLALADELLIADSAASFALKKATLTALQTVLVTAAKVNAVFAPGSLPTKATPVLADLSVIGDSAATNAAKTSTFTEIQTLLVTQAFINALGITAVNIGAISAASVETSVDLTEAATGDAVVGTLALRDNDGASVFSKLKLTTGPDTSVGTTSAMSGTPGSIIVATTAVTPSSIIFVSRNTVGGTLGNISVPQGSFITGTSFVINSSADETSTFNYLIIN